MTFRLCRLHIFSRQVRPSLAAALVALFFMGPIHNIYAASLEITGPPGVAVFLDGNAVGFLPLNGPLTVAPGRHELRCDLSGYAIYTQRLALPGQDDHLVLSIRLTPLSRRTAVGSNLLLAGLGQHYLGHSTRGWLYSAAEIGGLLTALAGEINRSSYRKDFLLLQDQYNTAINADRIATLRVETAKAYADMEDMEALRNTSLAVAGSTILLSMIDAWFSFPHISTGSGTLPLTTHSSLANPQQPGVHASLRLGF